MSRLLLVSPNKQALKKVQGQLKVSVSTYGSLILAWKCDIEETIALLRHYKDLSKKRQCIKQASIGPSYLASNFEEGSSIFAKVISLIDEDIESTLQQIRTFE